MDIETPINAGAPIGDAGDRRHRQGIDAVGQASDPTPESEFVQDESGSRRSFDLLRETLLTLIDTIPVPVFYKDKECRYRGVNAAFERMLGRTRASLCGSTVYDVAPTEWADKYDHWDRKLLADPGIQIYEGQVQTAGGAMRTVVFHKAVYRDPDGAVAGIVGAIIDVTDLRHAEDEQRQLTRQLSQAQKLEAIGQLAAGIAHEMNTPIQFVSDNVHFLRESFKQLLSVIRQLDAVVPTEDYARIMQGADIGFLIDEIPVAIDQVGDGMKRVSKIVHAMKDFSHPGDDEKTLFDINHALETTLTISRNEWKYVADTITNFDAVLPPVPCFAGHINQVFLNLIVNAAQAIEEGKQGPDSPKGVIEITTRRLDDRVEIRIADSGVGIPEAVRARIFEPFFTTKPAGKGTGQGLAIVQDIVVKRHGGEITFESEMGKGTTFVVQLPLHIESPGDRP